MEVKKSLWAESDCRQLINKKHQHGRCTLKEDRKKYEITCLVSQNSDTETCILKKASRLITKCGCVPYCHTQY